MLNEKYSNLLQPGKIGNLMLRNRIILAPAGTDSGEPDGRYSQRTIDYYRTIAAGGAGMLILEGHKAEEELELRSPWILGISSDFYLAPMVELADAVHGEGAKVCVQIAGGLGRNIFHDVLSAERPPISASDSPSFFNPSIKCRPLTVDEIHLLVKRYGEAVRRAVIAGYDAVEIHAHIGYLIDQFMSACWNQRTDEYGGNFDRRMRFAADIIAEIQKVAGKDFPIIFRYAADHRTPEGRNVEDSMQIAKRLEELGCAALHVDVGTYDNSHWSCPPSYLGEAPTIYVAEAVKSVVKIPVIGVGSLTPDTAEVSIREGKCDFAAFTRQFLADPEFPNKVSAGHPEDVRPCFRCNEYCNGNIFASKKVTCAVNAACGNERINTILPANAPLKIAVIGGGVGGMEAARVATLRGHKVTLFEKADKLGGMVDIIATADFKSQMKKLVGWFKVQLEKLQVDVRLNTEITADSAELEAFDKIIVAIGAVSFIPNIPGIEGENVIDVVDFHKGVKKVNGDNVVICGAGLSGCDCALDLVAEGKNVTLVEMKDSVAKEASYFIYKALIDILPERGVKFLVNHKIVEIGKDGVRAKKEDGSEVLIPADTIITAFGVKPLKADAERFQNKYYDARMIGDCLKPGKIGDAVRAGFFTANAL